MWMIVTESEDVELVIQEIQTIGIIIMNEINAWFKQADEIQKGINGKYKIYGFPINNQL